MVRNDLSEYSRRYYSDVSHYRNADQTGSRARTVGSGDDNGEEEEEE